MRFLLLSHEYTGFQWSHQDDQITLEWFGPVDFNEVEYIGLSNCHIYPLRDERRPYSAVLTANFIKPSIYNPSKVLSTLRIPPHCSHTPSTNYRGKFIGDS